MYLSSKLNSCVIAREPHMRDKPLIGVKVATNSAWRAADFPDLEARHTWLGSINKSHLRRLSMCSIIFKNASDHVLHPTWSTKDWPPRTLFQHNIGIVPSLALHILQHLWWEGHLDPSETRALIPRGILSQSWDKLACTLPDLDIYTLYI